MCDDDESVEAGVDVMGCSEGMARDLLREADLMLLSDAAFGKAAEASTTEESTYWARLGLVCRETEDFLAKQRVAVGPRPITVSDMLGLAERATLEQERQPTSEARKAYQLLARAACGVRDVLSAAGQSV